MIRQDSAKALAKKLQEHPVFQEYFIIVAAGDGRIDEDDEDAENKKSYNKVTEAIQKYEKTITLSVGQLTTGITIPEWSAVLMLSNVKSPALYMQTAFRAQNPCLFKGKVSFTGRKTLMYLILTRRVPLQFLSSLQMTCAKKLPQERETLISAGKISGSC